MQRGLFVLNRRDVRHIRRPVDLLMPVNVMTIVSRRNVLTGALAAPSILTIDPRRAAGQANFDWQRFKGQHIEIFLQKGRRADLLQQYQMEFEALTGISVGSEQIPEQQQLARTSCQPGSTCNGHAAGR
jgi:hypothetical protein